ncbi:DUF4868 domain-containing protein (plasmid) [Entomospira entomophila]|uniref:DUF4868 domain-containing protein n=1 Tax=Entomospira entomophila TaxID=2719988 RepID=A0A968KUK3_9SPIO|nr:Kiwa anti-phage protein KwaB-like domain-containing protein [Entomospira entomophilus]NIZ41566.1 DUF4868 domain-containing protein [Entomospira entomophilus]WDI36451.1 DUF4868 domain-containing protein [Entomospira entomophilus]
MSITKIQEACNFSSRITEWKVYMISYEHKKEPDKYTRYNVKFKSNKIKNELINDLFTSFKKIGENYEITPYGDAKGKNSIFKIDANSSKIKGNWQELTRNLNNVKDFNNNYQNIKAYLLEGTIEDKPEKIYWLAKKNPLKVVKRAFSFFQENTYDNIGNSLLYFEGNIDCLIYQDILYTVNYQFEDIFNMEKKHISSCKKKLNIIKDTGMIDDFGILEKESLKLKNARKYMTFDEKILKKLNEDDFRQRLITDGFGLTMEGDKIKFKSKNDVDKFINLVCDRIHRHITNDKELVYTLGVTQSPSETNTHQELI